MKKKLFTVLLGISILVPSNIIFAGEGAYEPPMMKQNIQENEITLDEISMMTTEELQELELVPVELNDARAVSRVKDYYLVPKYNIKQINGYYCGPATTLQMLKVSGKTGKVSGTTDAQKQKTLASNQYLGTDRDKATWINNIASTMNKLNPRSRAWTQKVINKNDKDSLAHMQYFIRANHAYNYAVDYLVYPEALSYYPNGSRSGHYISGSGIYYESNNAADYNNIKLRLNDPHYDNRYYGTHVEDFMNVVRAMHNYTVSRGPANLVY